MNLPLKALAVALLASSTLGLESRANAQSTTYGTNATAPVAQPVAWHGGGWHGGGWHGGWRGDRGWWGPGAIVGGIVGGALAAANPYGYDYGYDSAYGPGYAYDSAPGYSGYGYAAGNSGYGYAAPEGYGAPQAGAMSYCMSRFRSFDPASGTYLGYDGARHSCP
jgi:hypothetical protein